MIRRPSAATAIPTYGRSASFRVGLWFCGLALSAPLLAQHTPELVPRPGEQRFNHLQFHATHNSFERENGFLDRISITQQMDRYDAWMIEFDTRWNAGHGLWVFHDCGDGAGEGSLDGFLDEVKTTVRATTSLTVLYFDSGDIGPCFLYPNIVPKPANWRDLLQASLEARFGNGVYTWTDFQADNLKWPSHQELLRRGKHFIPIVNNVGSSVYFFGFSGGSNNNVMFENIDEETTTITAADLGDRSFARHYPTGWVCDVGGGAGSGNGGWQWAVDHNYSFAASNCSNVTSDHLHPPQPAYVGGPTAADSGRGTWLSPFWGTNGFKNAINRVQKHQNLEGPSTVTLQMNAGTYSAPSRISAAVRLTTAGGTTRLQVP